MDLTNDNQIMKAFCRDVCVARDHPWEPSLSKVSNIKESTVIDSLRIHTWTSMDTTWFDSPCPYHGTAIEASKSIGNINLFYFSGHSDRRLQLSPQSNFLHPICHGGQETIEAVRDEFKNALEEHYHGFSAILDRRSAKTFAGSHYRRDDLVDRYHNNIHFMNHEAQLIRDLFLLGLPTSVHSQSTMLGAFAARSSQVDYGERKQIDDFCRNYQYALALNDYTKDGFYYRVLNYVLRKVHYDVIYQYRHAIIDVIQCLRKLYASRNKTALWTLFRGQQMTVFELEKLKNNVGELVSCSSFFSTTFDLQLAQIFAGDGSADDPYLVSVIFQISLDTGQTMRPYARIENSGEEEVLFSPGTKFRLMSCRKLHDHGRVWLFEVLAIPEKQQEQLLLNHGETFLLLSSARGWPTRGRGCSSFNHLMRPLSKVETDLGHLH